MPLPGSPAIDAGDDALLATPDQIVADQRSVVRAQDVDTVAGGAGADTLKGTLGEIDEGFAYFAEWVDTV